MKEFLSRRQNDNEKPENCKKARCIGEILENPFLTRHLGILYICAYLLINEC